jgi:hypothetical protein
MFVVALWTMSLLALTGTVRAADTDKDDVRQPHTPTLIFYLSGAGSQPDADALRTSIQKLSSASLRSVDTNRSYVRVRFDSHVVSYHQVAQAIADAGTSLGKSYQPFAVFIVNEYARTNNAAGVDAIFAGKRLNTRVHVTPLDKSQGKFLVHFLPLKTDPAVTAPQGFNGGHLHHPVSDPPPRGLGLTSDYASEDDPAVPLKR